MPETVASEQQQASDPVGNFSAPLFDIPDYRIRNFIRGVADRVRVGGEAALADIRSERLALAHALASEPVRATFAKSYADQYNLLAGATPIELSSARNYTDEVLDNRINDARSLAALTQSPEFVAQVRSSVAQPANLGPYQLAPEKLDEMIERFAQAESRFGAEPKVHAQQSMDGHRIGHQALANCFAPDAGLNPVLTRALSAHLPADRAQALAADWMDARRKPAQATVEALAPHSALRHAVMARIDDARRSEHLTGRRISFAERVNSAPTNFTMGV